MVEYRVVRYGWPSLNKWRVVFAGSDEGRATREYEALATSLRRGGVALVRIDAGTRQLVEETWAATGRRSTTRGAAIQSASELLHLLT